MSLVDRLILLISPASALRRARRLEAEGQAAKAFPLLLRLAKSGNAEAERRVALGYLAGVGAPVSRSEGVRRLARAAERSDVEAQVTLAGLCLRGLADLGEASHGHAAARLFEMDAPRAPNYATARRWARAAALAGSPAGQALFAYILMHGPAESRDAAAARIWYRRSSDAGCAEGRLGYALSLAPEAKDDVSQRQVAELIRLAAAELPTAIYFLGLMTETGLGVERDSAAAVRCFERAAEKGVVAAQGRWGAALMDGAFVCRDHERAEHWLRRAGAGGDAEAAARVGDLHARGSLNSRPNFAEAAAWYRRAAEAGHKPAARALASLHLTGAGVAQDFAAAASWLRLAAGENDGRPGIVSGDVDGQIVDREGQKADVAALLEREAAKGDLVASLHLGLWLTQDVGRPSDRAKAAHRLRVGASETPTAQYLHGRMLAEGLGETADLEAARSLFARAAKAGIVDAQAALAEMLVNGRGGPADISEAARLFEQAAKQGHSGAMFALGVLHARGGQAGLAGAAALRWFREAARLGHGHAQLALARLLSSARFGEADHEEAEMWLRSAAENGLAEAQRQLAAERIRSERPASAPQSASVAT